MKPLKTFLNPPFPPSSAFKILCEPTWTTRTHMDKGRAGCELRFWSVCNRIKESKGTSTLSKFLLAMTYHSHHHPVTLNAADPGTAKERSFFKVISAAYPPPTHTHTTIVSSPKTKRWLHCAHFCIINHGSI